MERPKLTVAIATLRRWNSFLSQTLPIYLNSPFVDYVVICDDGGEDVDAIRETSYALNPKLRLYKNKVKLGAYYNKRQAFEKAPTDWVALLDSDNYFQESYFNTLNDVWLRNGGADTRTIYAAGQMTRFFVNGGLSEKKIEGFSGLKIDKSNWNTILEIQGWNFLLNDGNFVVHKSLLNILPDDVDDKNIMAADAIYVARKAVASGFTYWVVPELSYIHTVHDGSFWLETAAESSRILMGKDWRI
jgi:glycosyltransferase involved in cell wall biosynthesis